MTVTQLKWGMWAAGVLSGFVLRGFMHTFHIF